MEALPLVATEPMPLLGVDTLPLVADDALPLLPIAAAPAAPPEDPVLQPTPTEHSTDNRTQVNGFVMY